MKNYLKASPLLDFKHSAIEELIRQRKWAKLDETERIRRAYNFVRDEIRFGYNAGDNLPASAVLSQGYGQCNTKSTLLMALLRALKIPCRLHGFTIHKALQKGAVRGLWYQLAPQEILHTWVEVLHAGQWIFLEGVILDLPYLKALQLANKDCSGSFCGFGVATESLQRAKVEFHGSHTFIQKEGIARDFGLFDSPDEFYQSHGQELSRFKDWFYRNFVRHRMNRNVSRIREGRSGNAKSPKIK